MKIMIGDVVARKSYNKDIFFIVSQIINLNDGSSIAILKGMTKRIEADAPIIDLEKITGDTLKEKEKEFEKMLSSRINEFNNNYRLQRNYENGKILHLDGDKRYGEKTAKYYQKIGLKAVVKNVTESKQSSIVKLLLNRYKPDILIITGHDAMIKNGTNFYNIYNYRNSKYFSDTVREARSWEKNSDKLVIFAGACQSFYELLIESGANFASSPGRILIDFIDPLIVAEKVSTTDSRKFLSGYDIYKDIKEGEKGINGIGARGKRRVT